MAKATNKSLEQRIARVAGWPTHRLVFEVRLHLYEELGNGVYPSFFDDFAVDSLESAIRMVDENREVALIYYAYLVDENSGSKTDPSERQYLDAGLDCVAKGAPRGTRPPEEDSDSGHFYKLSGSDALPCLHLENVYENYRFTTRLAIAADSDERAVRAYRFAAKQFKRIVRTRLSIVEQLDDPRDRPHVEYKKL